MFYKTLRSAKELKKAGKETKGRSKGCLQGFGGLSCRRGNREGIEDSYLDF